MKKRSGSRGPFWGCTGYPSCRRTLPITAAAGAPTSSDDTAPADTTSTETRESWKAPEPPSYSEAASAYAAALARLDSDQRSVVEWDPSAGNLRVIAAAGSGKTTTVCALISRLVREQIRTPAQIIATTFTSKAGKELAERLNKTLPPGALPQMRVGTFHGLALRALRGQGSWDMPHCLDIGRRAAGIPSAGQLWSKALGYAGEGGMPGTGAEGLGLEEPDVKAYQLAVDVVRSRGVVGAELVDALQEVERESGLPYLVKAWSMVCDSKRALGAWDFADALQAWHDHLTRCEATPDVVVFVDEAQDNSKLQLDIARLLTRAGNLVLIGDTRQAIYSWRGAFPEFFTTAQDHIANLSTLQLRNNYRSGTAIVVVGNHCAEGQDWCVGDAAVAARAEAGKVDIQGYSDPADESRAVAESISRLAHDSDTPLDSVAILCRTNALSGAFEAACIAASIPCVVVGGKPFFQRFEVMNAMSYVKLSVADDLDAFARIVNKPRRYLGAKFVQAVKARLHTAGDLLAAVDSCITSLYPKQRDAAQEFYVWLSALRASKWPDALEMIVRLLSPAASSDSGEADNDRSGIVAAVASIGKYFPSAEAFCDFAERCAGEVVEARAEDGGFVLPAGRVTISTIHRAKGLEWAHVYVSCSAGVFPHAKSTSPARIAEERRLFYVAATRAKDELHLTHSAVDLYGRTAGPSPFLAYVSGPDGTPPTDPDGGGVKVTAVVHAPAELPQGTHEAKITHVEVTPAGNLVQHLDLSSAPTPAELSPVEALFGREAWAAARKAAEVATAATPAPTEGRYVPVEMAQFTELLSLLQFNEVGKCDQIVFEWATQREHGDLFLRVYTSVPLLATEARAAGEDSIKVAAVWFAGDKEKPLHKKLPYACRTRGWRVALLDRIEEVAGKIAVQCPRCSSPMSERRSMKSGQTIAAQVFMGCVRYPTCNGTREVK
jgi:DNA helicase-2/ATP-dependent DNA helicase PcrA